MLEIVQIPVLRDNYIFLLHEPKSNKTAVVDPAEAEPVLSHLQEKSWSLDYIFNTHHHADHVGGNLSLISETNCQVVAAAHDAHRIPGANILVTDKDRFNFGSLIFCIIGTPGHTSGHIVYYCESADALFCGDTLFAMGCGRLFEGSAQQLWQSLQFLYDLPGSTKIYCAHEYTYNNGRFALTVEADNVALQERMRVISAMVGSHQATIPTTLELELATNPFLRLDSPSIQRAVDRVGSAPEEVFGALRRLKDNF